MGSVGCTATDPTGARRQGCASKETRNTFVILGLIHGAPVKIISEALGHASVAITYDVYSHVIAGMQEDSLAHLDRLFSWRPPTNGDRFGTEHILEVVDENRRELEFGLK